MIGPPLSPARRSPHVFVLFACGLSLSVRVPQSGAPISMILSTLYLGTDTSSPYAALTERLPCSSSLECTPSHSPSIRCAHSASHASQCTVLRHESGWQWAGESDSNFDFNCAPSCRTLGDVAAEVARSKTHSSLSCCMRSGHPHSGAGVVS